MSFIKRESSPLYSAIPGETVVLKPRFYNQFDHSRCILWLPWLTTLLFVTTTIIALVAESTTEEFEAGWKTDFGPARAQVKVEQVQFYGGPAFKNDGTMYIPNPSPTKYIGSPAAEVDKNWQDLIWGRYFTISEAEAHAAWGENIENFWSEEAGGYLAGLDMFHTLHCLNEIRKLLDSENHSRPLDPLHYGHCIEQIRQYIMCAGDLTPLPTTYFKGINFNYVLSDQVHTCRSFDPIRHWMTDRNDQENRTRYG